MKNETNVNNKPEGEMTSLTESFINCFLLEFPQLFRQALKDREKMTELETKLQMCLSGIVQGREHFEKEIERVWFESKPGSLESIHFRSHLEEWFRIAIKTSPKIKEYNSLLAVVCFIIKEGLDRGVIKFKDINSKEKMRVFLKQKNIDISHNTAYQRMFSTYKGKPSFSTLTDEKFDNKDYVYAMKKYKDYFPE